MANLEVDAHRAPDLGVQPPGVPPAAEHDRRADTSLETRSLIFQEVHALSPIPGTIDECLAPLSHEKRAALEKIRKAIKAAECS